jgi:hypothetical protein
MFRRRHTLRARIVSPCGVVAALTVALAVPLRACSVASVNALVSPTTAFLLARAGTDTMQTGPGGVRYIVAPGHSGPASDRTVYGLVLDVERVAGPARAQLPANATRAIIVPWDYEAGCTPVPYALSARWVEAGLRGVFRAELRPRAAWANGIPTLDVFTPRTQPYAPGMRPLDGFRRIAPDSLLSLDETLDVFDRLPTREAMHNDATSAALRVFEWVRAHPLRASLYPVREISWTLHRMERMAALRDVRHPGVGTWWLQMEVTGRAAPLALYARTVATPTNGTYLRQSEAAGKDGVPAPFTSHGYLAFLARTEESLPTDCASRYAQPSRAGYVTMRPGPPDSTTEGARYPVNVQLDAFARLFAPDSSLHHIAQLAFRSYMAFSRADTVALHGAIFPDGPGSARLTQMETLPDGRQVTITGHRMP